MQLISYADLEKLRLSDFLDDEVEIDVEESGMDNLFGLGGWEQVGESSFEWRQAEEFRTSGVMLDCRPNAELPNDITSRIIERLGLPVTVGMSGAELIAVLGKPSTDKRGRPGLRLLDFLCGDQQEYVVGCCVDDQHGLVQIIFARADYFEEENGKLPRC